MIHLSIKVSLNALLDDKLKEIWNGVGLKALKFKKICVIQFACFIILPNSMNLLNFQKSFVAGQQQR